MTRDYSRSFVSKALDFRRHLIELEIAIAYRDGKSPFSVLSRVRFLHPGHE